MATKASFTSDEWKNVLQAPLLAGFAVSAADPSGFIGTLQEAFASARSLAEAKASGGGNELIKAIVEELLTSEGRANAREGIRSLVQGVQLRQLKGTALAALRETTDLLDKKAPDDAKAVKTWLGQVAQTVAEAGTEGGFLGFGGVKVSNVEKATLSEITATLGA